MYGRMLGSLASLVLLTLPVSAQVTSSTEKVYVYTLDQANSSFVMMGDAFQQTFTCSGVPIDPAPVPLGPIHACPSGNQIPVTLSGTLRLAIGRDPVTHGLRVRFAGGELLAGDIITPPGTYRQFSGTVGSCSSPDARLDVRNLRFNLGSAFVPLQRGTPVGGCAPTDNLGGFLSMHALDGDSIITTTLGSRTIPMDCKSSSPTPFCARLGAATFEMEIGAAAPLQFNFLHSVSSCTPFPLGRIDYTGNFRFSCSLKWQLTAILPGPGGDPTPNCP